MKTIYFVRHGETEENVKKLHQGPDGPLTVKGQQQSKIIAGRVAKLPIEAFIASPLVRTKETAELIAEKIGKRPEYSELFVEGRGPREFWGVSHEDPKAAEAFQLLRTNYGRPGWRYSDEENYEDHMLRARAALRLLEQRSDNNILVVTHGLFLRLMLANVFFDMNPSPAEVQKITWHSETANSGLTIFTYDEKRKTPWWLWVYNDHAHLAD